MTPAHHHEQIAQSRRLGIAARPHRVPRSRWPALIESDYAARLVGLVDQLRHAVTANTSALRFDDSRSAQARRAMDRARAAVEHDPGPERLAAEFARRTVAHQGAEFKRQARAALGVDVSPLDPHIASLVDGFVHENVALVRKLQGDTLGHLEVLLTRAAADGTGQEAIAEQIASRFGISERHARLIARDQVGKLNARLTQARSTELGIQSYDWISMLVGKNRRPEHVDRHGRRFRYDAPPRDGHPGHAICCMCLQQPAWDEVRAQVATVGWQGVVPMLARR